MSFRLLLAVRRPLIKIFNGNCCIFRQISTKKLQSLPVQVSSLFVRQCSSNDKKEDPPAESLVYKGDLKLQIVAVKALSLISSLAGLAAQPLLWYKMLESNIYITIAFGTFSVFFILCTPIFLHILTRRYVLQLTFNPETGNFSATTLTLFLRKKVTVFTANDVTIPEAGLITTFIAKKQPMFIDPNHIQNMKHFKHLMGYDKPVDLFLETPDKEKVEK
ncbi:transmembrane protein 70 homolog, mitochondrial-like isoform X2 [Centruroides sculpturatus]|uniref:transmembrane protein 70 homolog, mitochondrial-like isoform X2 n=1 Tax=Centruroides sculpturatus TaxID=218467 RepID=UPI000C6D9CE8|nr:transmembrane protein 70 homolog, mitochondrial-like isoform X2 [Centruroides sculpturatus]